LNPIATAKQTASLLSLAGLAWVISHLPTIPESAIYADLWRPAMAVLISALVYLLVLGLQAFTHSGDEHPSHRRELSWAVVHGLVLAAIGGALLRGARSYALTAGLEGLISVVAAISAVALFVYGYSAWVARRIEEPASDRHAAGAPMWITHALQVVACLPLLLSLAYLEFFPSEQAEQVQFHAGAEI
jgi:hypothetical protein